MKKVLAMMLVATRAFAEEPAPPPPPPEQPAPEQPAGPPGDPAYGEPPQRDPADGGGSYFAAPKGKDIYIRAYPDRSRANIIALSATAGVGAVFGAVGLYYHMDFNSKADDLAAHRATGKAWTADRQAEYDDAHSSSVKAGVFYGLGGAAVLGAAIAYIVTEPKVETIVIHPHVDPKTGSAMLSGGWRF